LPDETTSFDPTPRPSVGGSPNWKINWEFRTADPVEQFDAAFFPDRRAEALIHDWRRRQARGRGFKPDDTVALAFAVGDYAELQFRAGLDRLAGDVEFCRRGDEDARLAVIKNIGELAGREIRVDAGEIEARALASAAAFQVSAVVLHEDRKMIEPPKPTIAQQLRQALERASSSHRSLLRPCSP
jgi:hypothetical protein